MSDKMRGAFEDKYPLPEGVFWSDELGYYTTRSAEYILEMDGYNEFFEVWQAALTQQPKNRTVYQLRTEINGGRWSDVSEHDYWCKEGFHERRILYTSPQPTPQVPEGFEIEKNVRGEIRVELLGGTERGHASAWLTPHEDFEGRILYWLAHDLLASSTIKGPE